MEFLITNNLASTAGLLAIGKCDLIAFNITVTKQRSQIVDFSIPIMQTRQVLVQRIPCKTTESSIKNIKLIRYLADLHDKTIYIQKNSVHYNQLMDIQRIINGKIHIIESDSLETEQLMELVANGSIDYTVANETLH